VLWDICTQFGRLPHELGESMTAEQYAELEVIWMQKHGIEINTESPREYFRRMNG